jgi:hypothetical protein
MVWLIVCGVRNSQCVSCDSRVWSPCGTVVLAEDLFVDVVMLCSLGFKLVCQGRGHSFNISGLELCVRQV